VPAKSNAEWKKWGEVDPLFGVASWSGRRADEDNPWTEDEFYAMGRSDWADFLKQWQSYGVTPGVAVEIGSGAGRLTAPMASFFQHVHGVDVAPGMLAKAEAVVSELPVTMHLGDGLTLPLDTASCDAAFSTHVFQHFDSAADAEANWREVARVLKPSGTFLVHVPVHQWPGGLQQLQHVFNLRRKLGDVRAAAKRRKMTKSSGAPIMRGSSYAWNELEPLLKRLGFVDLELRFFRVTINQGQHAIVLGRRKA
jgi:ubiquinone/menaquinone biosynthesis C-methylase UbiE